MFFLSSSSCARRSSSHTGQHAMAQSCAAAYQCAPALCGWPPSSAWRAQRSRRSATDRTTGTWSATFFTPPRITAMSAPDRSSATGARW